MVKIFGTMKVYKNEKVLQGAKMVLVGDNDLTYHYLDVMNDWLYLTKKMPNLKDELISSNNEDAMDIARGGRYHGQGGNSNGTSKQNQGNQGSALDIVVNWITDYGRQSGAKISKAQLMQEVKRHTSNPMGIINNLIDSGYIAEDSDDFYTIC